MKFGHQAVSSITKATMFVFSVTGYLGVGADGERVAGGRGRGEFSSHARRGRGQVPDGQVGRLAAHDQRATVRQQLHRADVVVALL